MSDYWYTSCIYLVIRFMYIYPRFQGTLSQQVLTSMSKMFGMLLVHHKPLIYTEKSSYLPFPLKLISVCLLKRYCMVNNMVNTSVLH